MCQKKIYFILLADDDYLNYLYYREILPADQFEISYVTNGIDAISECQHNKKIDLVLMDLRMPGVNGKDAVHAIRKNNKNLPILFQSAYIKKEHVKSFENQKFIDYISKPVSEKEFLEKIKKLLK